MKVENEIKSERTGKARDPIKKLITQLNSGGR